MKLDTFRIVLESFQKVSVLFFENQAWMSQRRMEWERLGPEESIAPANKKCRVFSLPAGAPAAIMDMKEEDVLVEQVDGSGFKLSCTAKESYEMLKHAMKFMCLVHYVPFLRLLEAMEQSNEYILEKLQAVMCNSPSTSRQIVELSSS